MQPSVYAAVLKRAAELLGDVETLAAYLNVSPVRVQAWLGGHGLPPDDVFLRLVDLLSERDLAKLKTELRKK